MEVNSITLRQAINAFNDIINNPDSKVTKLKAQLWLETLKQHLPVFNFCKLTDDGISCIRLRNKKGKHCLSLLPCESSENGNVISVDLATPDGTVLYRGVPIELVNILVEELCIEEI